MAERGKVAVVGIGPIGKHHAEVWNGQPHGRVTLVCDLNAGSVDPRPPTARA